MFSCLWRMILPARYRVLATMILCTLFLGVAVFALAGPHKLSECLRNARIYSSPQAIGHGPEPSMHTAHGSSLGSGNPSSLARKPSGSTRHTFVSSPKVFNKSRHRVLEPEANNETEYWRKTGAWAECVSGYRAEVGLGAQPVREVGGNPSHNHGTGSLVIRTMKGPTQRTRPTGALSDEGRLDSGMRGRHAVAPGCAADVESTNPQFPDAEVSDKSSAGERATRVALEELFPGRRFPKSRPNFLRNPVTSKHGETPTPEILLEDPLDEGAIRGQHYLEIDCFNRELGIGVEYQGRQHTTYIPFFHRSVDAYENMKYRDNLKRRLCRENGIILLEIGYETAVGDIKGVLREKLGAAGIAVRGH